VRGVTALGQTLPKTVQPLGGTPLKDFVFGVGSGLGTYALLNESLIKKNIGGTLARIIGAFFLEYANGLWPWT